MKPRLLIFYLLLTISYLLLAARLIDLQVIHGQRNLELSEGNRVKIERVKAPRGIIYDRQGEALVYNVSVATSLPVDATHQALQAGEESTSSLTREYLYGEVLAHLIGYVNLDYQGVAGLEKEDDELLAGQDGGEIIETAADGSRLRQLGDYQPVPGENLYLTIDLKLQKAAYEALGDKKGAVVVSQPQTGEILVLVSKPSFDPNNIKEILHDPNQPLFNRATHGVYPPGSIFKIVTAAAGLESGQITPETLIEDTGEIRINQYRYGNWYFDRTGKTEGFLDLVQALKRSNDIFFYRLAEKVGSRTIIDWAKAFGLGQGIGYLPDPANEPWFLGNTYHLAIGQGKLGVTPLQVNLMTNVIANGGKLCQPKFLTGENTCQEIGLSEKTIEVIQEGMKEACREGGTSLRFLDFDFEVACKTGTAEFGSPTDETHAWFTMFVLPDEALAKSGADSISITVLVEAGGEGSQVAAPIAKEILSAYLTRSNLRRDLHGLTSLSN